MGRYVETSNRCRTQLLLEYFGEMNDDRCRVCDYCLNIRKKERLQEERQRLRGDLLEKVTSKPSLPQDLLQDFEPKYADVITALIRELLDLGLLQYGESGKLELCS